MAEGRPSGDGLGRWLVGGLIAGAILLGVILGAYELGSRSVTPHDAASSAPATTAPTATIPAPTPPGAPPPPAPRAGGVVTFAQSCAGCHVGNGTADGGVGPKLQGLGLAEDDIARQIEDGSAGMPGGLVAGADLNDVVAYVLSIQR